MGLRMLPYALLLTVAGLFSSALSASLVYDPVATAELEEAIKKDEFVVLVKGARGGKAGSGLLLELKFPGEMRHFSLLQKDDTVSVLHGGESVSWTVPRGAPLSLVWAQGSEEEERESSLRMYRACSPLEQLKTRSSPRDVFSSMEVPSVKLYRDKHVTVNILTGALSEVLGCPDPGWTPPLSRAHEKSRKHRKPPGASSREEEAGMMAHQPYDDNDVPYTRGDIPIIHTDNCDDLLVKTINELIKQIQMLKQEVERQRGEVGQLRRTLENCAGCREPPRVTCASRPGPCYPGE